MSRDDDLPADRLRRLADDAGAAARTPDFAGLAARGRRRRRVRRTTTGVAGLAAVAAIAVAAVTVPGQVESEPATPPHTHSHSPQPGPTTTKPPSQRYLLHHPVVLVKQPEARIVKASYADAQHAAALWEICTPVIDTDVCPEVVTWTSDGWATARAAVIPDKLDIYALRNGSVVVWLYGGGFVLGPDGSRHHITVADKPIARRPGGPLTNLSGVMYSRQAGLFDSRSDTVYPPLTSPSTYAVYYDQWDGNGTIWEYGASHIGPAKHASLVWSDDVGRTWSTVHVPSRPVLGLVVAGHRTAVLLGGQKAGQHAVLTNLLITSDGGASWHEQTLPPSSRTPVSSAAATQAGQLFICDGANIWAANAAWSALHLIQPGRVAATGVTAAGNEIIAYGDATDVQVSSDDGRTWHLVSPRP